jgi:hypothetical protein
VANEESADQAPVNEEHFYGKYTDSELFIALDGKFIHTN